MGLNSTFILGGVLMMALIAVSGSIWSPEKTTEILGFCGMITGTLLLMLKTDQDTRRLNKRIDASDVKTEQKAAEVKQAVQEKGTEVKQALRIADAAKQEQLTDLAKSASDLKEQMQSVDRKLNGAMDKKFESVEQKVQEGTTTVLEALPKVIEEVVPKVIPSPGSEK